jgi:hypothetical protein
LKGSNTMQDRGIECNHEICNCVVIGPIETGEAYCSDYCRGVTADGIESELCACGHPQCDTQ